MVPTFSAAVPADHWLLAKPAHATRLAAAGLPGGEASPIDPTPWDTAHTAASQMAYAHYFEPDVLHERAIPPSNVTRLSRVLIRTGRPPVPDSEGIPPDWHLGAGFGEFEAQRPSTTGAGIRIAHLDTGYTPGHQSVLHAASLNRSLAYDFWSNKPDAIDPYDQFLGVLQPGHGTATLALLAGNTMTLSFGMSTFHGDIGGAPDSRSDSRSNQSISSSSIYQHHG